MDMKRHKIRTSYQMRNKPTWEALKINYYSICFIEILDKNEEKQLRHEQKHPINA